MLAGVTGFAPLSSSAQAAPVEVPVPVFTANAIAGTHWISNITPETLEFLESGVVRQTSASGQIHHDFWHYWGNGQYRFGDTEIATLSFDGQNLILSRTTGGPRRLFQRIPAPAAPTIAITKKTPRDFFTSPEYNTDMNKTTFLPHSLHGVLSAALLAFNSFAVPVATADSNDTLFGRRAGADTSPQATTSPTTPTSSSGTAVAPVSADSIVPKITGTKWENSKDGMYGKSVYTLNADGTWFEDYGGGRKHGRWKQISPVEIQMMDESMVNIYFPFRLSSDGQEFFRSNDRRTYRRTTPITSLPTAKHVLIGTAWSRTDENGVIHTTEFRPDDKVRHFDGKKEQIGTWKIAGERGAIVDEHSWKLSADGKFLLTHYRDGGVWETLYRGTSGTPPIATTNHVLRGTVWSKTESDGSISILEFRADGRLRSRNGAKEDLSAWRIVDERRVGHAGGYGRPKHTYVLSGDGKTLAVHYGHGPYWFSWYAGTSGKPSAVAVAPVSASIAAKITETKWERTEVGSIYTFSADGTWTEHWNGRVNRGKWWQIAPDVVQGAVGLASDWTFRLSADGQTLTRNDGGGWRRTVSVNSQTTTLRTEFNTLNKQCDAFFVEFMRPYNHEATNRLESLKSQIGTSDIDLLKRIQDTFDTMANNSSFEVRGLVEKKKLTTHERSFVSIKIARDRNIASAQKNASSRSKSAYNELLKRAVAAKEFELAKEIQAQMAVLAPTTSVVVGNWRECQGSGRRVVLSKDGTVWHEDGNISGSWKQVSSGVFTITKKEDRFWSGATWRISSDGKTLTKTDVHAAGKLVRE
jgi:hypothetical protein